MFGCMADIGIGLFHFLFVPDIEASWSAAEIQVL